MIRRKASLSTSFDLFHSQAVGLGVNMVVFGAPCRGENIMRLNRIQEIEDVVNEDERLRWICHVVFTILAALFFM